MSLANLITLARLLSAPLLVWLILGSNFVATFWVFLAAGLSDAVDGFVAKRFDQRSKFGALLDPIADKTLIVSLFVTLGISGFLANWLVILVVFRDLLIVGGFLLAAALGQAITWRPLMVSKVNTALQLVLIVALLAQLAFRYDDHGALAALIYVVGATTILSGGGYIVRWANAFGGAAAEP